MNKIYRWRHQEVSLQFLAVIQGIACILDGLVIVLTLGFCGAGFACAVARHRAGRFIKIMKKRETSV